jgi:putative FmdB family regulatory protein
VPIYEFYCAKCHTIFNFLARKPEGNKMPACPRCGRPQLERRLSRFAVSKGRSEERGDEAPPADIDESKLEQVMAEMEHEAGGMNEDDPRQIARLMHKLQEATGMRLGDHMQEAMRRMEAGEDPDKIEEEMGDLLEAEEPEFGASGGSLRQWSRKLRPPQVDETLYDL